MTIEIITQPQEGIIRFAEEILDAQFGVMATGIGVAIDGKPIAAFVFHGYQEDARWIEVSIASRDKRWATRRVLHAVSDYVFNTLGCHLMQTTTVSDPKKKAKRLRNFNERLGFRFEGKMRDRYGPGIGAYVFSMTKEECKWLRKPEKKEGKVHGEISTQGASTA